jgi:hypothetical protein
MFPSGFVRVSTSELFVQNWDAKHAGKNAKNKHEIKTEILPNTAIFLSKSCQVS